MLKFPGQEKTELYSSFLVHGQEKLFLKALTDQYAPEFYSISNLIGPPKRVLTLRGNLRSIAEEQFEEPELTLTYLAINNAINDLITIYQPVMLQRYAGARALGLGISFAFKLSKREEDLMSLVKATGDKDSANYLLMELLNIHKFGSGKPETKRLEELAAPQPKE